MQIVKEFRMRNIAGDYVLIPIGATTREFNGIISVSSTAKCIWENIEKVGSLDELIDMITEKFEIDRETAAEDTTEFVRQLLAVGFVKYTDENIKW